MTVHDEVRQWASELAPWLQDALRRLDESEALTDKDIDELTLLLKRENAVPLPEGTTLAAKPIAFPASASAEGAGAVSIRKLSNLQNINALAEDQPIEFAPNGVTVMFGDNGSGKSGFGRLLRTVCWARNRPEVILGNIDTKDTRAQKATITYRIGDADQPPYEWTPGERPPEALGLVSVYDADCGWVYLNKEQQAAYVPFGLDYFPRLADVCDRVRAKLKAEREACERELSSWPGVDISSLTGKQLTLLPTVAAKKAVRETTALSRDEEKTLGELAKTLDELKREDPRRRVLSLRNDAKKLRGYKESISSVENALTQTRIDTLRAAIEAVKLKEAASRLASDKALGKDVLPGTGGSVWEELWKAAKKFSAVAYPDAAFPSCEHGSRCVLCQQELGADAVSRFKAFDEFVRAEAATQAQRAKEDLAKLRSALANLVCTRSDLDTVVEDLNLREDGLGQSFKEWLVAAEQRRSSSHDAADSDGLASLVQLPESPEQRIEALAVAVETRANELEAAIDDTARIAKEAQCAELQARKWVCEHRDHIDEEIKKREYVALLSKLAGNPTNTTKITTTGSGLTEKYVTEAHKDRFKEELRGLRAANLGVELGVNRGAKGKTMHHLLLTRGEGQSIASILSTGERNVVGLAAFFAELQPDSAHGIILDDPVSSLDQDRRDDVARRLATESTKRQVIVWTHDLTFVGALSEATDALKDTTFAIVTLSNLNGQTGVVDQRAPWPLMNIRERIKKLRLDLDDVRAAATAKDAAKHQATVRLFYGHLRDSWERATEELLFNNVIRRWRKGVQTKQLADVADRVTKSDCELIDAEMTRSSNFAHDQQTQTPPPVPKVADLEADLGKLVAWYDQRRKPKS